jgi:hypothetical protein
MNIMCLIIGHDYCDLFGKQTCRYCKKENMNTIKKRIAMFRKGFRFENNDPCLHL